MEHTSSTSGVAKLVRMELLHTPTCMYIEGDLTKQEKNLESYHTM
jgi:hypothetical protein